MERGANASRPPGRREGVDPPRVAPLFRKGDPRSVLSRLKDEDLDLISTRVALQVRRRAFLLDGERVLAKALAQMAYDCANAPTDDGEYSEWEVQRIDLAIHEHLRDDEQRFEAGLFPLTVDADPRCGFVRDLARIEPGLALFCANLFNSLPEAQRRAFVEVFVHDTTPEDCIAAGIAADANGLHRLLSQALIAFRPEVLLPPGHFGDTTEEEE